MRCFVLFLSLLLMSVYPVSVYAEKSAINNLSSAIEQSLNYSILYNTTYASVISANNRIKNYGTLDNISENFIKNSLLENGSTGGAAIYNEGTITSVTGYFTDNFAGSINSYAFGGAIYNSGTIDKIIVSDSGFTGNYTISYTDDVYSNDAYGGAIYNSGTINEITSDFIGNYASGIYCYAGAIYSDSSSKIGTISGKFLNNYAKGASAYGGAIFTAYGSTIDLLSGDFTGNYVMSIDDGSGGGAIYNSGTINEIICDFTGNYSSGHSTYGGAIVQFFASIGTIEGNFNGNYAKGSDFLGLGGAIYSYFAMITSITGDFNNNYAISDASYAYGGAIGNEYGMIGSITGDFDGNYVFCATSGSGGAIYNSGTISSITGSFTNNYVLGGTEALGGAIYTESSLTIYSTGAGKVDLFSGNYVSTDNGITKTYQAIYVNNKNATLTLNASNYGIIEFDDIIDGITGYNVLITGDSAEESMGVVKLFNDINNANITTENVIISFEDGKTHDYEFYSLTSNSSSLWEFDVDLASGKADTITLLNSSSGTITINNINFISSTTSDEPIIIQILYNASGVELELGENIHIVEDIYSELPDRVHSSERYCLENGITITTTNTQNDSIEISPEKVYDTLAVINQKESENRSFVFDEETSLYTATDDIGETTSGTFNIVGNSDDNSTINFNSHSGFILGDDAILNISDVIITGASGEGGSVFNVGEGGMVNITDSVITSNTSDDYVINNAGTINIEAYNSNIEIADNSSDTSSAPINNRGIINMIASENADIILKDSITGETTTDENGNSTPAGTINILGSSDSAFIRIENEITSNTVNMNSGTLLFTTSTDKNGNTISGNLGDDVNFNYYSGGVSLQDDSINSANLGNVTLYGNMSLTLDADLSNAVMDTITASGFDSNGYSINISKINITSPTTEKTVTISPLGDIEDEAVKSTMAAAIEYTGGDVAYSPIYKYSVSYDPDSALLTFGLSGGNDYSDYNPSIFAAPVTAQLGGYLTQLNSYDEAFQNMDIYMSFTAEQRQSLKFMNKYADLNPDTFKVYKPVKTEQRGALWARPYSTFESVRLRGGPRVSNVAYGSFFGGESKMYELPHGWDSVLGAYVGYNGSHQAYQSIDIYQNGGTIGLVGMVYKGNFYSGLTVNIGANGAEASTMYGSDNFAMLMTGVAWKTGYNIEFAGGKFIIQPSYLMSYTFVDTFDYTNAAGVRIKSDPLNAIQIEPGVKFIGNLHKGWQPYLGVSMVWNIIDSTKFRANDAALPELSVKPFVKYGVGMRRMWRERFSGYFQTYITNGGRNGVGLQFGFRVAF